MKKFLKTYAIPLVLSLFIVGGLVAGKFQSTGGLVTYPVQMFHDTNSNSMGDSVTVSVSDYDKITFYTGSSGNDSSSYHYRLWLGVGGMWTQIWADSITTTTATNGIVGVDAATLTIDFSKTVVATPLDSSLVTTAYFVTWPVGTEIKWVRINKSTGNGTGPATNKTRANDYFVGMRRQ